MTKPNEIASGVLVFTSATMSTTSTVIADGEAALLVDPAWQSDELVGIADELDLRGLQVELGWSTHAHHDHLLWHERFGSAPRLATPDAATMAKRQLSEIRSELEAILRPLAGLVSGYDSARLPWPRQVAEVVAHDGHAAGHGALWLPEQRLLVAGDMLSDVEIPLLAESGLDAYRQGLELLAPYVRRAEVLVPGHGGVARAGTSDSPAARLRADRAYLASLAKGNGHDDPRLGNGTEWLRAEHEANRAVP